MIRDLWDRVHGVKLGRGVSEFVMLSKLLEIHELYCSMISFTWDLLCNECWFSLSRNACRLILTSSGLDDEIFLLVKSGSFCIKS